MNEIEKAIRHFENMRNENIVVLNTGFGDKPNEHNTLYANRKLYADLAIQALQEKQERDKMRCENCKYQKNVMGQFNVCDECSIKYQSFFESKEGKENA